MIKSTDKLTALLIILATLTTTTTLGTPTVDCGDVPTLENGQISLDNGTSTFGSKATVNCSEGYDAKPTNITCLSTGHWSTASCELKDCGDVPTLENGQISLDNGTSTFGSKATVNCSEGYDAKPTNITCLSTGHWSTASCELKDCGDVPTLENGQISLDNGTSTFGSKATVNCSEGYDAKPTNITCLSTGHWSTASCELKDCGDVPTLENGQISLDNGTSTFGSKATVNCSEGYDAKPTNITCLSTGHWSTASCELKDCGDVPTLENGQISLDNGTSTFGSKATVNCSEGYDAKPTNITCLSTGHWSTASCELKDCGDVPTLENGQISLDNGTSTFGSKATVNCSEGYDAKPTNITCLSTGHWSTASCELKDCGDVPTLENGQISLDNGTSTFGSKATVNCSEGYDAKPTNITCLSTGHWSTASCELKAVEYNETCVRLHENACIGNNTVCKDTGTGEMRCLCENDYVYIVSDAACYKKLNVDLELLSMHAIQVKTNSITLQWIFKKSFDAKFSSIVIDVFQSGRLHITVPRNRSDHTFVEYEIEDLTPGTNYTFKYYLKSERGIPSNSDNVSSFTQPLPLNQSAKVVNITEHSFTIKWTDDKALNYANYLIVIAPVEKNLTSNCSNFEYGNCTILRSDNVTSLEYWGLDPGTEYTIIIYTSAGGIISDPGLDAKQFTLPVLPEKLNIPSNNITNTSFIIEYVDTDPKFTNWIVTVNDTEQTLEPKNVSKTATSVTINDLKPGTEYFITVYTEVPGFESSKTNTTTIFTRPSDPSLIYIPKEYVHSDSLMVQYDVWDENYDYLELLICNTSYMNMSVVKGGNKTVNVSDLNIATNYTFELFTKLNNSRFNFKSQRPARAWSYTAPRQPNASRGKVEFRLVSINLTGNENKLFDNYSIEFMNETTDTYQTKTVSRDENNVKIPGLTAGTNYTFRIFTVLTEIKSDTSTSFSTYTRPLGIENITVKNTTANSISINWNPPNEGIASKYEVQFTCESPNKGTEINKTQVYNTSHFTSMAANLDPGTSCNVSITTHIGDQAGDLLFCKLNRTSREKAPNEVNITEASTDKKSLQIKWDKPLVPNGVVRKYKMLVVDNFTNCLIAKHTYNCKSEICEDNQTYMCESYNFTEPAQCNDVLLDETTDIFLNNQTIKDLHPYRNYIVYIQAFTKCWGMAVSEELRTKTDIPRAIQTVDVTGTSKNSIDVLWQHLDVEDRNGIITDYTIRYIYNNRTCYDTEDGANVTKYINNINASYTSYPVELLQPYWLYDIAVSASTSAGDGPFSACNLTTCHVRTSETIPGKIRSDTVTETESTFVKLKWESPCRPNGVIVGYVFSVFNQDTQTESTIESKDNQTEYIISSLPFRNYTIKVAAKTVNGTGEFTTGLYVQTKIAEPETPNDPNPTAQNSSSLNVTWTSLPQSKYTGPTTFTAKATDDHNTSFTESCTTLGFNSTSCLITGLDAFWNYTVTLTAITTAGNNTSKSIQGTTAEATPGPVSSVSLSTENNVTKVRSIIVTWKPPSKRDLNGILIKYHINCTNTDDGKVISKFTDVNKRSCQFIDIKPGNYNVTVYARTKAGPGNLSLETTRVKPGAPLKPVESGDSLLMTQSSKGVVSDDERQISVQLPSSKFLCNMTNGRPIRWGVVVVQDGNEDNDPFFGTVEKFNKTRFSVYKRWSQVKDDDSISAYVATPETWLPECASLLDGNRHKRAVEDKTRDQTFTVGEQDECSGVSDSQYCNGQLQPGRKYRIRSFVCTVEGCTETMYSRPISTKPDPTVPIAAGTSSAIVVLVIVAAVVFILRRRQLACFSKDPERSLPTHRPGGDISLDPIETKKKNAFSPGPAKLSDFPNIVENMHRDSDLLFADAYKMLKEQSPNHPMTAAEQQCCRPKNRYTNILPFDHSRVKLRPSDDMEGSDYINANYIPGYTSRREYIATQGPMQATFDDFWRMVWEQNVDTIVMLTKLMEKGRRKCDKYWPDLGEPVFYGDLVVSIQSESNLSDYVIKIIEIKMKEEKKMIRHFSYLKWPDMGCPDTPELLLEFVKAVRQYTNREKQPSTGPVIVHCSAGVGRTGTFIAVDYLLQHIRDHDEVDIFSLVLDMRNHRLNMVQTEDQYVYIHECLKAFITTDEEEEDDDEEPVYMNTGMQEDNVYENTAFKRD